MGAGDRGRRRGRRRGLGQRVAPLRRGGRRSGGCARRVWPLRTRGARIIAGAAALLAGAVLIGRPTLALDVVVVAGGVLLLYFGAGELLSAVGVPPQTERALARTQPRPSGRRREQPRRC